MECKIFTRSSTGLRRDGAAYLADTWQTSGAQQNMLVAWLWLRVVSSLVNGKALRLLKPVLISEDVHDLDQRRLGRTEILEPSRVVSN